MYHPDYATPGCTHLLSFGWVAHTELLRIFSMTDPDAAGWAERIRAARDADGAGSWVARMRAAAAVHAVTQRLAPPPRAESAGRPHRSFAGLAGYIFRCNNATMEECLRRQMLGDTTAQRARIELGLAVGHTRLFLFNTTTKLIYGTYVPTDVGFIEPTAWHVGSDSVRRRAPSFSAQCRFKEWEKLRPIPESEYRQVPGHRAPSTPSPTHPALALALALILASTSNRCSSTSAAIRATTSNWSSMRRPPISCCVRVAPTRQNR